MPTRALSTAGESALVDALTRHGEPAWRARQLQGAIWQPFVGDFEGMLQLPAALRRALAAEFEFSSVAVGTEMLADSGQTIKLLGQGLTGTTAVSFNGTAATFNVASDTYLTATVPTGATSGTVQVTTPGGTLLSNVAFRVKP